MILWFSGTVWSRNNQNQFTSVFAPGLTDNFNPMFLHLRCLVASFPIAWWSFSLLTSSTISGLLWMPETSFVTTEVDAWLIIAKSSLLVSSLLASLACASSSPASTSSRVLWGPWQVFSCLHRVSAEVCHNLTCTRMCRHRMECSGSNVVVMPNYFWQCTCICGISSPPCLLLYIHSGYVFLCAFACTLLLYASSQPAIISHYSCVKTKSANSLLRLHCFALMPPCRLLTNNWARSPRDRHQEEVISQPAIVSDYCEFFADKCPPVDVFCNHVKARKKVWVQNEMDVETYNTTNIFNSTLQFMKYFFLFWWQFMTWNIAPKFLFKVKSELWKLKMGCNKLARNSLRPANFTSPHFHERRWLSWWTHERLHLHVIICLNCSCPWKLFWQANRTRALSIN